VGGKISGDWDNEKKKEQDGSWPTTWLGGVVHSKAEPNNPPQQKINAAYEDDFNEWYQQCPLKKKRKGKKTHRFEKEKGGGKIGNWYADMWPGSKKAPRRHFWGGRGKSLFREWRKAV